MTTSPSFFVLVVYGLLICLLAYLCDTYLTILFWKKTLRSARNVQERAAAICPKSVKLAVNTMLCFEQRMNTVFDTCK